MIQLFAAAKCHATPSWVKRFMNQIKHFKKFAAAPRECACLQDGADDESQMYVLFCYFA